ncbi:hypothetical protein Lser_V15G02377 [Lactuca serriola]
MDILKPVVDEVEEIYWPPRNPNALNLMEKLCIWNINGWEKRKSRNIQSPPGHPSSLVGETKVQFHNDQRHLLVVHESQIAIYDHQLECLKLRHAIAAIASIKVDFGGNGGHARAALMPQRFGYC